MSSLDFIRRFREGRTEKKWELGAQREFGVVQWGETGASHSHYAIQWTQGDIYHWPQVQQIHRNIQVGGQPHLIHLLCNKQGNSSHKIRVQAKEPGHKVRICVLPKL